VITRCPRSVCTRTSADPKGLSQKARKRKNHERIRKASPPSRTASGTAGVQWKRRASRGISAIQATKPTITR